MSRLPAPTAPPRCCRIPRKSAAAASTLTPIDATTNGSFACMIPVASRPPETRMSRRLTTITTTGSAYRGSATARVGDVRAQTEGRPLRTTERTAHAGCASGLPVDLALDSLASAVEVTELALQVRLEPGAVLALERLEPLDVLLQRHPLAVEAAHGLLVPLPGVALERLRLAAGLA